MKAFRKYYICTVKPGNNQHFRVKGPYGLGGQNRKLVSHLHSNNGDRKSSKLASERLGFFRSGQRHPVRLIEVVCAHPTGM